MATWTFTSSKFTSATDKVFHPITLGILDFYVFLTMLVSAKSLPMGSPCESHPIGEEIQSLKEFKGDQPNSNKKYPSRQVNMLGGCKWK